MGKVLFMRKGRIHTSPEKTVQLSTTFAQKESDWIEEGGSFNYGNGLYVTEGSTKGTIKVDSDYRKYLTIPFSSKTIDLTFTGRVTTANNASIGGYLVNLFNENNEVIASMRHTDSWAADKVQVINYIIGGSGAEIDRNSNYNGVDQTWRLVYNGSIVTIFLNGRQIVSKETSIKGKVSKLRIEFTSYLNTTQYPITGIRIGSLTITNK